MYSIIITDPRNNEKGTFQTVCKHFVAAGLDQSEGDGTRGLGLGLL